MANCHGTIPCSTKIDASMCEFIEAEADRLRISKAEFHRRLLDFYRESREEETNCPNCEVSITIPLDS
jgi:hypothetical protein